MKQSQEGGGLARATETRAARSASRGFVAKWQAETVSRDASLALYSRTSHGMYPYITPLIISLPRLRLTKPRAEDG